MQAALGGAALGVIGALAGAVLALWWRSKYHKAQGRAALLAQRLATEEEQHDETLRRAKEAAEQYEHSEDKLEAVIDDLQGRYDALLRRSLENADHHELLDLANRPPAPIELRLVHPNEGRDEVENEDGHSS